MKRKRRPKDRHTTSELAAMGFPVQDLLIRRNITINFAKARCLPRYFAWCGGRSKQPKYTYSTNA